MAYVLERATSQVFMAPGPTRLTPVINDPNNSQQFLADCCVIDPTAKVPFVDLVGRFRLWARTTNVAPLKLLKDYLRANNYKDTTVYVPDMYSEFAGFSGLRIVPLPPFTISSASSEVEEFLYDVAEPSYVGRILQLNLINAYVAWRDNGHGYYSITNADKTTLQNHMMINFMFTNMNRCVTGRDGMASGYFGLRLKGDMTRGLTGKKMPIEKVDPTTQQVVDTYMSLSHAANSNEMETADLRKKVKGRKLHDGYIYRYNTAPPTASADAGSADPGAADAIE